MVGTFETTNPPTPAASRGSASEEALLATRGEKRKFAGAVLRPCCLAVAEMPFRSDS